MSAVREQDETASADNETAALSEEPTQPASPEPAETEPAPPKSTRGRRGGGRARGSRGRGRGRGGRGGGTTVPRVVPAKDLIQTLKDRQKALGANYKKVVAAQKRALAVLGERTQNSLMRSKTVHTKVPEYSAIMKSLHRLHEERRQNILNEHEFAMRNEEENYRLKADLIERTHRVSLLIFFSFLFFFSLSLYLFSSWYTNDS